ncbi:MAG: ligand-binding sensor domain-containing protein [Agriterribacter sp.]
MRLYPIVIQLVLCLAGGCLKAQLSYIPSTVNDAPFWQEYHEPFPVSNIAAGNEVRSIASDHTGAIWIATSAGIFKKEKDSKKWNKVIAGGEDGPAYTVQSHAATGKVWIGAWNGVFCIDNGTMKKVQGTVGPVSVLCFSKEGVYAFGPKGAWLCADKTFERKNYPIARSVRAAISDKQGGVWVTSDVGLYHCTPDTTKYYDGTNLLVSAYVKGLAYNYDHQLWIGGLGGVSVIEEEKKVKFLQPANGIPSIYVNCVAAAPDSSMWIGTDVGIVRYHADGKRSLRFSRRWLLNDKVNAIHFDKEGTAWIATPAGVSAIRKKRMTLAEKAGFFYDVTMKRHVRAPWIVGQCRLPDPLDLTRWEPEDDDNDGEFGGNYLAMESFRYAVTKSEDAKVKAKKSFEFLKLLQTITGTDGFFARTIVPVEWGNNVHDANRKFLPEELAEELVKEPRFKPVETRWRKSKDGKWLWKGDTSSDEWCGHMTGYFFYYELVADKNEKAIVAAHVSRLVDHLIKNNFNMIDIDGTHTRWSVWSPDNLNRDPEWRPDRYQNSMEILTFLKLAYYMTGNNKYQEEYLRLIKNEHYLENMSKIQEQNPAWFIYFDVILQAYLYPVLLHCEKDPELLSFYEKHMDSWMEKRIDDKCPLINFLYSFSRNKKAELQASVDFLTDTPLDLVNWGVDHTKREDVQMVHAPVLDDLQVSELPPASIRATVRWDKNPWAAINGQTNTEREPVFWLLPYWMGRYLQMIE